MSNNMIEFQDAAGAAVRVPETATQTLTREYSQDGRPFSVIHRDIHSTRALRWNIVDARPGAAPTQAFAILPAGSVSYFSYKEGDSIPDGAGGNRIADYGDTCLTSPRRTPNQESLAIGAISFGYRSTRVVYPAAAIAAAVLATGGGALNAVTQAALEGKVPLWDPASLVSPAQVDAPFNLEKGFDQLMRPFLKAEFVWNGKTSSYAGMCSAFPNSAAVSYQRSAGVAKLDNAFLVPEGLIWRREGDDKGDTELEVRITIVRDLIVPISLPPLPLLGETGVAADDRIFPEALITDMTVRLHAVCFGVTSSNAG